MILPVNTNKIFYMSWVKDITFWIYCILHCGSQTFGLPNHYDKGLAHHLFATNFTKNHFKQLNNDNMNIFNNCF